MSLGIQVQLLNDAATPAIQKFVAGIKPESIQPIVGNSAKKLLKSHLVGLEQRRENKFGGARTHFYAQASKGVSFEAVGNHVLVSIASVGIRQRYFGGTIKPVSKKLLTIPARAESYGKRASEFSDLKVLVGRNGPYALARRASSLLATRQVQGGEVLFWLVKEVTQRADPTVLPTKAELQAHVQKDLTSYVTRLAARESK